MRLILAPSHQTVGLEKFGLNPYREPNFRVIWAPSRTRIIGGFWEDTARHEYRKLPKYGLSPRWILERWRPAAMYGTPQAWEREYITPDGFFAVGPFPVHGEYESCEVFQLSDEKGKAIKGWADLCHSNRGWSNSPRARCGWEESIPTPIFALQ